MRNALTAAAILSITLNPLLYRLVGPLEAALGRFFKGTAPPDVLKDLGKAAGGPTRDVPDRARRSRYRAVIVGYGPVGRTLARLLRENHFEPVVIELNHETVRRLNGEGTAAIYGDAAHRETLEQAGLANAVALFLSSSHMEGDREAIRQARELNPRILIFARSAYLREIADLRRAGADLVFSGEGEVALAMTEFLLRQRGRDARADRPGAGADPVGPVPRVAAPRSSARRPAIARRRGGSPVIWGKPVHFEADDGLPGISAGSVILYAANNGTSSNIWNLCVFGVALSPLWTVGNLCQTRPHRVY